MLKKLIALPIAASFLLFGAAASGSEDFAAAWEAADAKRKEAAAVGYEWRDTKKFLKKAKAEHEAGNTEVAMALVARALEESKDAIAQEAREANLWADRVLK